MRIFAAASSTEKREREKRITPMWFSMNLGVSTAWYRIERWFEANVDELTPVYMRTKWLISTALSGRFYGIAATPHIHAYSISQPHYLKERRHYVPLKATA